MGRTVFRSVSVLVALVIYSSITLIHSFNLPLINLNESPQTISAKLRNAASNFGFFYLINHGINPKLLHDVLEQNRAAFNLSEHVKLSYARNHTHYGYTAVGAAKNGASRWDSHESWYFGDERNTDFGHYIAYVNNNLWPDELSKSAFKHTVNQYFAEVTNLGLRMNKYVCMSLDLSPDYLNQDEYFGANRRVTSMRLIHYTPQLSDETSGVFGTGDHTDHSMLTFLLTDGTQGLQILDQKTNEWVFVPHVENAFIVNIGDGLQRWTNDLYVSITHRVVTMNEVDRYSIVFFWDPVPEARIECLPTICDSDNPPKYMPCSHMNVLQQKVYSAFGK